MLDYLKSLILPDQTFDADERRRQETEKDQQARKLEMDEPMEGAGALLAAEQNESETGENLKRATRDHG